MTSFEDTLEVEFKFIPEKREIDVVGDFARLFGPNYGFAMWPPCANLDIYLDTPDFLLYETNAPLRLRRWATPYKLKQGISANFKYPPEPGEGLHRRELKTILSEEEARRVCGGAIVGDTLKHAATWSGASENATAAFTPKVMISTQQALYVLRQRVGVDSTATGRGKEADLLLLTFERCTVREVPEKAVSRLLRNGMLDVDPGRRVFEFFEAELEIVAPATRFDLASELYAQAFCMVRESGAKMPCLSKYSTAIRAIYGHYE